MLVLPAPGRVAADAPAAERSVARFEVRFMQGMIDHHAMAIEMAEACLDKAVHEDLRSLCQDIIDAQSAETEELQGFLADWYGLSYEPQMTRGDMRQVERFASLDGAQFEISFMEEMIKHHRTAIRMAEQCVDRVAHPELESLCEDIIEAQAAEIEQLRTWLCDWYDQCRKD